MESGWGYGVGVGTSYIARLVSSNGRKEERGSEDEDVAEDESISKECCRIEADREKITGERRGEKGGKGRSRRLVARWNKLRWMVRKKVHQNKQGRIHGYPSRVWVGRGSGRKGH